MASFATVEIVDGVSSLRCPITGKAVIVEEQGFDPAALHSPHIRFFVDWIGQIWIADPASLPHDHADYQSALEEVLSNPLDGEDLESMITRCLAVLPSSALVLEISNPARGGGFDGETIYVCWDLDQTDSNQLISLREVHR